MDAYSYIAFNVIVASEEGLRIPAEALVTTKDLAAALHALDVFLLHAPFASCSVFLSTERLMPTRILRVEGGRWRVVGDIPEAEAAA